MAFSQNTRPLTSAASTSTADNRNTSNPLNISYGKGPRDWSKPSKPTASIWSTGGLGNRLASRDATRESSREGPRSSGQDEFLSNGQVVSRAAASDDRWHSEWNPSHNRPLSGISFGEEQKSQQQRSMSYNMSSHPMQSSALTASRSGSEQTIALQGQGYPTANSMTGRRYEHAPNVYTKHGPHLDRAANPRDALTRNGPTSNGMSMASGGVGRPSPPDSRNVSRPMSRNNSQPNTCDFPSFTKPDYTGTSQRPGQNTSQMPSISSQFNISSSNSPGVFNFEQLPSHFGQLSLNGNGQPQTAHRSSNGSFTNPFATTHETGSNATRAPMSRAKNGSIGLGPRDDFGPEEDQYAGFSTALPPLATSFTGSEYGGAYPPTPGSAEFKPGQQFFTGQASMRGFDPSTGRKSSSDWQAQANGMQLSRPSMSASDQYAYMTPQVQQFLAAQAAQFQRNYFNAYGSAMHFNGMNGLLPVAPMPMPMSQIDTSTPAQEMMVGEGIQSALLYDFKTNAKSRRFELRDIYTYVAEFSGDQHGSRFIQTKLETANSEEKERVFKEIEPNALQLMTDVFGNYVIQKFFEHGDQTHKKILANKMQGHMLQLSNQMYGCRVVQKALDHVLVDQQAQLINELQGHVLNCVKDQNGNHVIQKAIERCPAHTIGFIISSFQGSVQQLSVNSYGCRVIQRCLEHCSKSDKTLIMAELMDGIQHMTTDQYGNYVVQHVVERDDGEGRRNVLNIVAKDLEFFSTHKFASNVVEKCLQWADDSWRQEVLWRLSNSDRRGSDGQSVLVSMIKDNYGNYVIQKLLDTICPTDYYSFLEYLQPAVSQAKRTGCGKQIQSVERKMERFSRARHNFPLPSMPQALPPPTAPVAPFNATPSYQFGRAAPPFASNYGSAQGTPPPLTAGQSGRQSLGGDAVEGAHASLVRKEGEMRAMETFVR